MVSVKEERPDEAEIQAMAEKMIEDQKAKMTALPNQWNQRVSANGVISAIVSNVLGIRNNAVVNVPAAKLSEGKPVDEDSQRGRFGWTVLGQEPIPYILRQGVKYSSVRMVESKVLNKYLTYLHADIYNFTTIRSYYITDAESRLLNEINIKHCDGHYGRDHFTNKDLVVRLQDTEQFYNFLDVCYNRLHFKTTGSPQRCGFIRINNESVVPYTMKDNIKYVPLFYFEGETATLQTRAETLEGWDLAYLKFCCKVQGIRNELFASETCSVISLDDIMSYFPSGTKFDDYWPKSVTDVQLIAKNPVANASWTRQPAGAVPVTPATTKPVAPLSRSFPTDHTPPAAGTPGVAAAAALPQAMSHSWMIQQQQQQQHQEQQRFVNAMASNPRNWQPNMNGYGHYQNQIPLQQQPPPQKPQPPPLVRSAPAPPNVVVPHISPIEPRRYAIPKNIAMRSQTMHVNAGRLCFPGNLMDLPGQQQVYHSPMNGRSKAQKQTSVDDIPLPGPQPPYTVSNVFKN